MRPADQSARGPRPRVPLRSGLVALLALSALAGCGDPSTSASSADVVTTGPEPGAEIATTPGTTTPTDATTPSTTPADDRKKKKRDKSDRKSEAKPTPTPIGERASAGGDPEPTIMPATTLKPKEPTDAVDLAFARELLIHLAAGSVMAQVVEVRGQNPEFRALSTKIVDRASDASGKLQTWGDVLGPVLSQAVDTKYLDDDMRLLGVTPKEMKQSRALLLIDHELFSDVPDEDFDETALTAMIKHHESAIAIAGGTIQTGGSPRFEKFAAKYERAKRDELEQLRAFERDL